MLLQIPPDSVGDTTKRLAAHLEDITLHPQLGDLPLEFPEPSPLIAAQGSVLLPLLRSFLGQSGRPGESHPRAPTERSVNLSVHSALLT
jgi:hypothetical protein